MPKFSSRLAVQLLQWPTPILVGAWPIHSPNTTDISNFIPIPHSHSTSQHSHQYNPHKIPSNHTTSTQVCLPPSSPTTLPPQSPWFTSMSHPSQATCPPNIAQHVASPSTPSTHIIIAQLTAYNSLASSLIPWLSVHMCHTLPLPMLNPLPSSLPHHGQILLSINPCLSRSPHPL